MKMGATISIVTLPIQEYRPTELNRPETQSETGRDGDRQGEGDIRTRTGNGRRQDNYKWSMKEAK